MAANRKGTRRRTLKRALASRRGESLIEVLASILVITLGMTMLAGAIVAAAKVDYSAGSKTRDNDRNQIINMLETGEKTAGRRSTDTDSVSVTSDTALGINGTYTVEKTQVGELVYYEKQ